MIEQWREFLYPLGFLSGIFFGIRFFNQWIQSEIKKKSIIPKSFWHFSLTGNAILLVHALIQVQFHVGIAQACSTVICWRSLNLMHNKENLLPLRKVIMILFSSALSVIIFFSAQSYLTGDYNWFHSAREVRNEWHFFGFLSVALISSRFWVQWWLNEKHGKCELGPVFWWMSLGGIACCFTYFTRIDDPVNYIAPACAIIPNIRNLILISKTKKAAAL